MRRNVLGLVRWPLFLSEMARIDEKSVFSLACVHNQESRHTTNTRHQTNTVAATRRMSSDGDDTVRNASDSADLSHRDY